MASDGGSSAFDSLADDKVGDHGGEGINWTTSNVALSVFLFVLAGVLEIGGGWLVWKAVREDKPWWWAVAGGAVLVAYGFAPCGQPDGATFGRVFAVYGGFFIAMSYGWGWAMDGDKPDKGDIVGGAVTMAGVLICLFWSR